MIRYPNHVVASCKKLPSAGAAYAPEFDAAPSPRLHESTLNCLSCGSGRQREILPLSGGQVLHAIGRSHWLNASGSLRRALRPRQKQCGCSPRAGAPTRGWQPGHLKSSRKFPASSLLSHINSEPAGIWRPICEAITAYGRVSGSSRPGAPPSRAVPEALLPRSHHRQSRARSTFKC